MQRNIARIVFENIFVMDELSIWMKGVLSGGPVRVDGTTFYLHSGKVRVCSSRRGKRKSRTEGEKRVTERFTEVRKMWRVFRRVFGELAVWDVAAREAGKVRGDALFHALNGGCIRPGEGVCAVPCAERGVHPPGRRGVGMERVQLCGGEPGQGGGGGGAP